MGAYNVISWHEMLKRMEELGYVYTGDYSFIPNGYQRKQPLYRFDYRGGKGSKKLSLQELKEKFDGQITIMTGTHRHAPEQSFFLLTNKLYDNTAADAKAKNTNSGTMKVRFDVDWDCDENECDLESKFIANVDFDGIDISDEEAVSEYLSEWLSEEYGFTHNGFAYEIIGGSMMESKPTVLESTINRIREWMNQKECACISAYRNKLENQVPNTNTDGLEDGHIFTKKENQERSKLLKAWLLKLGYGVTAQDGIYVEELSGQKSDGKEVSFMVVNLNDDPLFFDNLFRIAEYFDQDSFLYKRPEKEEAFLVGTNKAEFPGYRAMKSIGTFKPIADEGFLSKIGSRAYQFRHNENKGISESIELAVCESTFKTQQMNSKVIIDDLYKKFPWRDINAKWHKANSQNG